MPLTAYWVGANIVAAQTAEQALAVIERHEPAGRYSPEDVAALDASALAVPVDVGQPETASDVLSRRPDPGGYLIRWHYPG